MTDQLRQAAQQALEALEEHEGNYKLGKSGCERQEKAITAIKKALAQPPLPEQEPVVCRFCHSKKGCWTWLCDSCGEIDNVQQPPPLPEQQAEPCIAKDPRCPCQDGDACHYKDCGDTKAWPVPQAEPVSCRFCHDKKGCWAWQCYKCGEIDDVQQPAAQRKPLTDEEIRRIKPVSPDFVDFRSGVRCAEAAHGIKE